MEQVYIRMKDPSGSFYSAADGVKLGGLANKPVRVYKSNAIKRAIQNKTLEVVPDTEAKKILGIAEKTPAKEVQEKLKQGTSGINLESFNPKEDTPEKGEQSGEKEEIAKAIEEDDYSRMLEVAKKNGATFDGRPRKSEVRKALNDFLSQ